MNPLLIIFAAIVVGILIALLQRWLRRRVWIECTPERRISYIPRRDLDKWRP